MIRNKILILAITLILLIVSGCAHDLSYITTNDNGIVVNLSALSNGPDKPLVTELMPGTYSINLINLLQGGEYIT